ncbi:unnamed protein product [Ostreobium quekettii]|uniref:Pentapeptide repeat n=1 Tax=Ostreobium quekettii TaxID=121088 RepID=A0A8S1IQP2_9CHLO|nr:unnamed protein product [Ostreobium quekettii]|eukprot:evm.model.scf_249.12 EVM.evm.TU.scf_249.12   scf_249:83071-86548(+)
MNAMAAHASSQCPSLAAGFRPPRPAVRPRASRAMVIDVGCVCGPREANSGGEEGGRQVAWGSAVAGAAAGLLLAASSAVAAPKLPPLSTDPARCERAFVGNTIGQANAVSDQVLDLRSCSYTGKNLSGKTLAGALLSDADLAKSNLQEIVLTKAYAVGANFEGADLTSAVVDRVNFDEANMKNAKMVNAVITGATFNGANLDGTDFEDALIGFEDVKKLCLNPTLTGESRAQVGCRQ